MHGGGLVTIDSGTRIELRGGTVWSATGEEAAPADVVVEDGQISSVSAPSTEGVAGASVTAIDATGCTIVPGLIEGHTHLCFNADADWREVYDADSDGAMLLRMAGAAQRMLRAGITTVRDLGAPTHLAVELRDAIAGGLVVGPDLIVAGAPVTTTGGHCYFMGGEADGELGVRVAVRERARAGVDWIKVMASGGNMTPGTNVNAAQYTVGELSAIVAEAHRLGRRVAAHCHGVEGIRVAVAARVDTLEHCSFQTPDGSVKDDAVISEIAANGLVVSPTLSVGLERWRGTERFDRRGELTRALLAAGCDVMMSTDSGIPAAPHDALARSIALLAELGDLSPVEALTIATRRTAAALDLGDRGTIEPGKRADLLIVEGDPLTDLDALTRVRAVVAGGAVVRD
jgi:imidazolonepropionase-like amidohydrolase